jgi:transposase
LPAEASGRVSPPSSFCGPRGLLRPLVEATGPELLALYGVGVEVAAVLLVAAGDNPERIKSEAAFAHRCGVAPLEASSGR